MKPLITHTGIVAPLDRNNVDTDLIIPKQFLKKTGRAGFGQHLFHEIRYLDYEGTRENPTFVLNQPAYRAASVLLARDNFGCGSSREHAPWALEDFGFRVIIAPSFADIFYNNSLKNGILLVRLTSSEVNALFTEAAARPGCTITTDLLAQTVTSPGGRAYRFEIHPFAKECLMKGLDQIGWTLQFDDLIRSYEAGLATTTPWLA